MESWKMRRFKIPSVQFPKLLPKGLSPLCILLNKVLIAQLCLVLCDPMDCSPPGCSVHGIFQTKILEQVTIPYSWIFPTQGSNLGLLHCRQILHCLRQNSQAKCLHLHSTLAHPSQLQDESGDIKSQGLSFTILLTSKSGEFARKE